MALRTIAAGFLVALLSFAFPALSAEAQERSELPSEVHPSVQSAQSLPTAQMPPVNREALPENDGSQNNRIGPYPYGTVLDTRLTPEQDGTWEQLPSGDWLWRLRLQSDEAVSLSVAFTRFQLPEGAAVYLHGPGNADVRGPYTAADATNGQHWTPLVHGEEVIIEMEVPDDQRAAVQLEVGRVIHGSRSISPTVTRNDLSKSGTCNVDVACDEADPWRKEVRSVGLYTYEKNGTSFACSGSLVNNTAKDKTPYFLTAEHCVTSPEVAPSMVFYWNYQNSTCRLRGTSENGTPTDDPRTDQTSSGAVLRARYGTVHENGLPPSGKPDLALVEIDDEIPERYNLYFNGWSREGTAPSKGVTIHHPSADGKRISFDEDPSTITAYAESGGGSTHLRIGDWELGTTEGGSSGAPLFNPDHQVVGVLSGGLAGCETGSADDNDQPDWYGRIAPGFENGDYEGHTLADWLDPRNTGTDTLDGMSQNETADLISPARIQDFHISRVNTSEREIALQWTATGDDNRKGTATRYDLRFDTAPIRSKEDFQQAQQVSDVPAPAQAGQSESLVVDDTDGLEQEQTYYFALVAVDDAGNRSPRTIPDRKAVLAKDIEIGKGGVATGAGRAVSETQFVLNETQDVKIVLYDLLGRPVRVVFEDRVEEGFEQIVRFRTSSLSSGPYFLHFTGENFATTRKIIVVN